jgi:hypothetical protein
MVAIMLAGCGPSATPSDQRQAASDAPQATAPASTNAEAAGKTAMNDPAVAVYDFLEGIKQGEDEKVSQRMTKLAREKIGQQGLAVAPQRSDTAKFQVGQVKYVGDNGAQVAATWTDWDANHEQQTDNMVWVVRKEPEGWRVLGMAAEVFPGESPLLLNFEEPDQTREKLQWLQEELRRRAAGTESLQAKRPPAQQQKNSPPAIQR